MEACLLAHANPPECRQSLHSRQRHHHYQSNLRRREMMAQNKNQLGSVISGTLDQEDLLDAFASELRRLVPDHPLVKQAYALTAEWGEGTPEEAQQLYDLVYELEDALSELCPPFLYFGPHPG